MKRLSALLVMLVVCFWYQTAWAQATTAWASVSLKGEKLTVWMPKSHKEKTQEFSFENFKLDGTVNTATEDGVDYIAWSLIDKGDRQTAAGYFYEDACADLVWESLLKSRRDDVPKEPATLSRMKFERMLLWPNLLTGREYSIVLGNRPGRMRFFVNNPELYVLIVLNDDSSSAQRFLDSFGPKRSELPVGADQTLMTSARNVVIGTGGGVIGPGDGAGVGSGVGPGRGGNTGGGDFPKPDDASAGGAVDYNKVFSGKDVTQKARITFKPEPVYTESARKYGVTGTVVLRAVFSRTGQVTQIRAISGLPHGLTALVINAARQIKFIPAQKDGHDVSMWFQLEYNFNLY